MVTFCRLMDPADFQGFYYRKGVRTIANGQVDKSSKPYFRDAVRNITLWATKFVND